MADTIHFTVPSSESSEKISGQIDWPIGRLEKFNGATVVLVSAASPSDRDGWLVRSIDANWKNTRPLQTLSKFLLKSGLAVVRFDNPGVRPYLKKCRSSVEAGKLTDYTLHRYCVDIKSLQRLSAQRYVRSIERVLEYAQRSMPSASRRFVLVGISEGFWHVDEIVRRARIRPLAVIAIGGSAESPKSLSQWQAIDRPLQTLYEFDFNGDGITTNEEIISGYKIGLGHITDHVDDWLSPYGSWTEANVQRFKDRLEASYRQLLAITKDTKEPGALNWAVMKNGVSVPDVTESVWALHLYGADSPLQTLKQKGVPALFIWGGSDRQVRVSYQVEAIEEIKASGTDIQYFIYPELHHLLAETKDTDWFDDSTGQSVAVAIEKFVRRRIYIRRRNVH